MSAAGLTPGELYRSFDHRTKKSLGQHFLIDSMLLEEIATLADVRSEDRILEIGPGCGTLTLALLQRGTQVDAIELDHRAVEFLEDELVPHFPLVIHEGSALEINLGELLASTPIPWKVVANLPYNVATAVMFRLFEERARVETMTLMFQREVADRIVAEVGDTDYGRLSLMVQLYSDVHLAMTLPPGAFVPPPKVRSAVVQFRLREDTRIEDPELRGQFERIVAAAFQARRKTLANGLKAIGCDKSVVGSALESLGLNDKIRPQRVSFEQFVALAEMLIEEGELTSETQH